MTSTTARAIDASELHPLFTPFYGTDRRVKVETVYRDVTGAVLSSYVRCGRVGRSSGWKPVYLLMSRSNALGSGDVLSPDGALRDGSMTWETRPIAVSDGYGHYYRPHGYAAPVLTDRCGYHDAPGREDD